LAHCLGVAPANSDIAYEPSLTQTRSFLIYNTDQVSFEAKLTLEGALAQYITLQEDQIHLNATEESHRIEYTITLPEIIEPGDYQSKIRVREVSTPASGRVSASLSVSHQLSMHVPPSGKYPKVEIQTEGKKLIIAITNKGTWISMRSSLELSSLRIASASFLKSSSPFN